MADPNPSNLQIQSLQEIRYSLSKSILKFMLKIDIINIFWKNGNEDEMINDSLIITWTAMASAPSLVACPPMKPLVWMKMEPGIPIYRRVHEKEQMKIDIRK